ncbi:hypothetical protein CC80DRAFT_489069 [Byssothecium circinans]|uniref:SH3 domain-containing protein n=1 Tax=Byssothecium circinans TaxID=147558 RepID=A0A6A5UAG5_9PLEO|nr:hypothetical protein CC80DRAFT_489069 [Byssothecium circinans]
MPNFKVKASYKYESPHEDDLSFPEGQIITVTEQEDDDWYVGEYIDETGSKHEGLFPRNFVERYEPELPARPNRASRHKPLEQVTAQPAPPTPDIPQQQQQQQQEPEPVQQDAPNPQPPPVEIPEAARSPTLSPRSPTSTRSAKAPEIPQAQEPPAAPKVPAAEPAAAPPTKKAPPPVASKSNAFRDRIAAFNQPAAAPIQPYKAGGGPPSTFIKKPFVAPPPSRNAYVPPPREPPQVKSYRRDEDPEVAERQAQDQENAERAGLAGNTNEGEGEEPAPTVSLKERIALLQKQQQEQAARAAALHKEKPKRPTTRKRTESHGARGEEDESGLDRSVTSDSKERGSMDNARPPRPAHGMKSPEHRDLNDANDADQSGAGETEDAEGSSTSVDDDDERAKHARAPGAPVREPDVGDEQDVEEEEEEEDEEAAEIRRKAAIRDRMARLGGGFGMPGMNPFAMNSAAGATSQTKKKVAEKQSTGDSEEYAMPQQRVPMFGMPGMIRSPEVENKQLAVEKEDEESHPITQSHAADEVPDVEDVAQHPLRTPTAEHPPLPDRRSMQDPPTERGIPPPIPSASRPPPPAPIRSPSPGSESGDELTDAQAQSVASPRTPSALPPSKRSSYLASDEMSVDSPDKRAMPPIPIASPTLSPTAVSRPPPPPPPFSPVSRQGTIENASRKLDREGETDYEGDYDTDIASGAPHKDALKSHARESSMEDNMTADEGSVRSPITPLAPPPLPPSVPRAVPPPPPPPQQPPNRTSMDAPRGAPPPVPAPSRDFDDDDYDPYKYTAPPPAPRAVPPPENYPHLPPRPPQPAMPPMPPPIPQQATELSDDSDDLYSQPKPRKSHDRPPPPPPQAAPHNHRPPPLPQDRAPPPPPPQERGPPPPPPAEPSQPHRAPSNRKSLDVNRAMQGRTSVDQPRPSVSQEFIARDIDLGVSSHWWTQPNMLPPSLQGRTDVLTELHESRSGETVEKLIQVLYMDYSQTIISARFEANNVSNVELEQQQEPPPMRLRQDQLEAAHEQFGARIAKDAESKQNTSVRDGSPMGFINQLLSPYKDALKPVSTRSFGALVYANLANASVQQYDEIRPGDIVTFRNTQFKGTHGRMHQKYSFELGKPDFVAVVVEWDGSKKKVRVWEQGKEKPKVKEVSYKLEDLRRGEVKVWRVMGRHWVGWN